MRAHFLILSYLTLTIANTCDRLKPLYKSFGCYDGGITYECSDMTGYVNGRCHFNGTNYKNGAVLPEKYPGVEDTELCTYKCHAKGSAGSYFEYSDCDYATPDPEYDNQCIHDELYNSDYFNERRAPIFINGRRCPVMWARAPPREVVSDPDCIMNPHACCQFGTHNFSMNTGFEFSNVVSCNCSCPPLVECWVH